MRSCNNRSVLEVRKVLVAKQVREKLCATFLLFACGVILEVFMDKDYRYKISAHNDALADSPAGRPSFFVRTYGCQMNSRDSEKLSALLIQLGYTAANSQEEADFVLYNTCCVRESAEDRIFGNLGRLKRAKQDKRNLFIAVCGCMAQQPEIAEKIKQSHRYINLVFGTHNRHRLPELLWQAIETGKQVIDINEDEGLPELEDVPATTREFAHKAGVNIMYGCDNFCSYCIVPYVRGREKSRPAADVLHEVAELAHDGVKEIMLLGQNVNSYEFGFAQLLRDVAKVEGIQRIRFMTSHPKDFSDELVQAVADIPQICKSIHLPIQSGSTRILQDMNRMYTQADYLELIQKLRAAVPDIAISTDIIVGYPGETEDDFLATLDVVRKVRFATAFTFIYSKRSGTPAAQRTDIVQPKIASERYDRLVADVSPILLEINEAKIGHTFDTMVEDITADGYKGRTDDHSLVHFTSAAALVPGDIVSVEITHARTYYISGRCT